MRTLRALAAEGLLGVSAVAVVGFGLLQGARLLDGGSGPYSQDPYAIYGLTVDGLTFLVVALLSYFAHIERPGKLFAVGAMATVVYVAMASVGGSGVAFSLVKQTFAGVGWSANILCWMYVFTRYRPHIALLMIVFGYMVDVAIQPVLAWMPPDAHVFIPVFLLSVCLLWACLRRCDLVGEAMREPSSPQTNIKEAFSRTRRAVVATFAFSAVCGFVVESDALLFGVQYSQTIPTALVCLVMAVGMAAVLVAFRVRKANIDYISPVAAIAIATVLAMRCFGIGSVQFSGSLMTATLISFYVFLWLMFISEAFERTLPAFFLLGIALAVARLSVAFGRLAALWADGAFGLDDTLVSVFAMWMLVITVSGVFVAQHRYSEKLRARAYDLLAEQGGFDAVAGCASGIGSAGELDARATATQADASDADCVVGALDPPSEALTSEERALDALAASFGLSAREADVLRDFATGRTARYIADWYMISEHTVKTHLRRAYAKLGIHSRQELLDLVDETVAQSYRSAAG